MNHGHSRNVRPSAGGFTLLELIVVITIVGLLGTIVAVQTQGVSNTGRVTKANADMGAILRAAKIIYTTTGHYPETIDDMVGRSDGLGLEDYPTDPWEGDYEYIVVDGQPQVTCLGGDKATGGEGIDQDLVLPKRP